MEVKINKEIREYSESIFFGLNLRQLIFSLNYTKHLIRHMLNLLISMVELPITDEKQNYKI